MRNTEIRFKTPQPIAPGPGTYDIKSYWPGSKDDICGLLMPFLFHSEKIKVS